MFKKYFGIILVAVLAFTVVGCETGNPDTTKGAVGGGLVGAIAGGVIGHQMGHGIEGAAIGGTLGAVTGGVVGHQIGEKKQAQAEAATAQSNAAVAAGQEKIGISDVIVLAKSGVTDDAIIGKIAKSGSVYNLSVEEIEQLRKEGVSNTVINYMMSTTRK